MCLSDCVHCCGVLFSLHTDVSHLFMPCDITLTVSRCVTFVRAAFVGRCKDVCFVMNGCVLSVSPCLPKASDWSNKYPSDK